MIGHRTLSTQLCLVISNSCEDEFLGNIVIVPGTCVTFVLSEFLGFDNVYLLIIFLNMFLSPLGMAIGPMCTEQSVLMMTQQTHWLVQSVTIPLELTGSTCLSLLCMCLAVVCHSDEMLHMVGLVSSLFDKFVPPCP